MSGRCATCTYWGDKSWVDTIDERYPADRFREYRDCANPSLFATGAHEGGPAYCGISTAPDFGCVQWAEKTRPGDDRDG